MRRSKLYLIILFLWLAMAACKENTTKNLTTIKFTKNEYGHIVIPFQINESIVYGAFDTGAQCSTIIECERERVDLAKSNDSVLVWFRALDYEPYYAFKTDSTHLSFNDINIKDPIEFSIVDNITIIGNDIIDQFNWLFDFNTNDLTISDKPIPFDTTGSIIIYYSNKFGFKVCSLYITRIGLLDDILIDSGHSWITTTDNKSYSIYLCLPDPMQDRRNSNLKIFDEYENCKSDSTDFHSPFINVADGNHITIYEGLRMFFQSPSFKYSSDINGIISLPYPTGYSYMYLDTQNNKIYLKK